MISSHIAKYLFDASAVKVSIHPPFTWTSGIKSPIYCDNRVLISHVTAREVVVKAFVDMIKEKGLKPDYIAGTATAAIPWASFVAHEMHLPLIYIRPEKKQHGAGKQIEGDLKPGSNVLLLEDLVSTGKSCVAAAEVIRSEGKGTIADIFSIVTWEMKPASEAFAASDLKLTSLTSYPHIIKEAVERGVVSQADYEMILTFKDDPEGWASNYLSQ